MNLKPGSKRCAQNHGTSGMETSRPARAKMFGDPADGVFLLFRNKDEQKRADQRREKNDRENVIMHKSSRRSLVFSRRQTFACYRTA